MGVKRENIPQAWWDRDSVIASITSDVLGNESISEDHVNEVLTRVFDDYRATLEDDTLYKLNREHVPASLAEERHDDIYSSLSSTKHGGAEMKKTAAAKGIRKKAGEIAGVIALLRKTAGCSDPELRKEAGESLVAIADALGINIRKQPGPFAPLFKKAGIEKLYPKLGKAMENKYGGKPDVRKLAADIQSLQELMKLFETLDISAEDDERTVETIGTKPGAVDMATENILEGQPPIL